MLVYGFDPGLRHFGFASAELEDGELRFTELSTLRTNPGNGSAAWGLLRRTGELFRSLAAYPAPDAVCVEAMSHPPSASSAAKLGATHGVVASLCTFWGLKRVYCKSPQHVRKTVCGVKGASEEAAHTALLSQYYELHEREAALYRWARPHALDAACTIFAAYKEAAL